MQILQNDCTRFKHTFSLEQMEQIKVNKDIEHLDNVYSKVDLYNRRIYNLQPKMLILLKI